MPNVVLVDANAICSARQLADVLALTVRQVHHLQTEGILRKARGKLQGYKLADSVQAYLRYQHDYLKRKFSINGDAAYSDARSRRMSALAIVEETRAKQLSGEFVSRARVVLVMTQLLTQTKNHMLALPARLYRQLIGQKDPHKVRSLLDAAIRNCLIEASKFGSQSFDEHGKKAVRKNGDRDDHD